VEQSHERRRREEEEDGQGGEVSGEFVHEVIVVRDEHS
jgi:hypothetical protein